MSGHLGPWAAKRSFVGDTYHIMSSPINGRVYRLFAGEHGTEADALLAAAAPDLLKALEIAKAAFLSDPPSGPQKSIVGDDTIYHLDGAKVGNALNAIRTAILKATNPKGGK